jgi:hypothetical protein
VGVGATAERALVPAGQRHDGVAAPDPESEDRPSQVVPVDDETGAAQPGRDDGDEQRGDRRRILHEDHVRLAHVGRQHPD